MRWLKLTTSLVGLLALAALLLAWVFLLRPTFLGGPASYVLVSGVSMEPTLHTGDLVLTRQRGDYGPGDIVVFRVPDGNLGAGGTVIHRIVGGDPEEGFVVQGDNKDAPDEWRPKPEDIVGKKWVAIPSGAPFVVRLRAPMNLGLLAGGLGMLMVLLSEWHLALPALGRRRGHPPQGSEKP